MSAVSCECPDEYRCRVKYLLQHGFHLGIVAIGHLAEKVVGIFLAGDAYLVGDIGLDGVVALEKVLPQSGIDGAALAEVAKYVVGMSLALQFIVIPPLVETLMDSFPRIDLAGFDLTDELVNRLLGHQLSSQIDPLANALAIAQCGIGERAVFLCI